MIAYCRVCNENHQFTDDEGERMIYVLQNELHDAEIDPSILLNTHYQDGYCIKETLGNGADGEMYRETVDAMVTERHKRMDPRCRDCNHRHPVVEGGRRAPKGGYLCVAPHPQEEPHRCAWWASQCRNGPHGVPGGMGAAG